MTSENATENDVLHSDIPSATTPYLETAPKSPSTSTNNREGRPRPSPSPPPLRSRIDSADIPRTYSGLYGRGGELTQQTPNSDLLPFELARNRNTDFLHVHPNRSSAISLLFTYIFILILTQFTFFAITPFLGMDIQTSWTLTNFFHGVITIGYFHWIKGSPDFYEQGELNAMTWWEQLAADPSDSSTSILVNTKTVLFVIPTILCLLACNFGNYDKVLCLINVGVWAVCIVSKFEFMNGVRVLGINRTIGIDDDLRKRD